MCSSGTLFLVNIYKTVVERANGTRLKWHMLRTNLKVIMRLILLIIITIFSGKPHTYSSFIIVISMHISFINCFIILLYVLVAIILTFERTVIMIVLCIS